MVLWNSLLSMRAQFLVLAWTQWMVCTVSVAQTVQGVSSIPCVVFIADTGKAVFVWIGGGASSDEKKHAMAYAHVSDTCPLPS